MNPLPARCLDLNVAAARTRMDHEQDNDEKKEDRDKCMFPGNAVAVQPVELRTVRKNEIDDLVDKRNLPCAGLSGSHNWNPLARFGDVPGYILLWRHKIVLLMSGVRFGCEMDVWYCPTRRRSAA